MYAFSYFEKLLSSSSDGYVNLYEINETEGIFKQQFKEKECTYLHIKSIPLVSSGSTRKPSSTAAAMRPGPTSGT